MKNGPGLRGEVKSERALAWGWVGLLLWGVEVAVCENFFNVHDIHKGMMGVPSPSPTSSGSVLVKRTGWGQTKTSKTHSAVGANRVVFSFPSVGNGPGIVRVGEGRMATAKGGHKVWLMGGNGDPCRASIEEQLSLSPRTSTSWALG